MRAGGRTDGRVGNLSTKIHFLPAFLQKELKIHSSQSITCADTAAGSFYEFQYTYFHLKNVKSEVRCTYLEKVYLFVEKSNLKIILKVEKTSFFALENELRVEQTVMYRKYKEFFKLLQNCNIF